MHETKCGLSSGALDIQSSLKHHNWEKIVQLCSVTTFVINHYLIDLLYIRSSFIQDKAWLAGEFKSIYFPFLIKIILLVSVMFLIYSGNVLLFEGTVKLQ